MIGDWIVDVRLWWKQFWCIHQYEPWTSPFGTMGWNECSKCGRSKDHYG